MPADPRRSGRSLGERGAQGSGDAHPGGGAGASATGVPDGGAGRAAAWNGCQSGREKPAGAALRGAGMENPSRRGAERGKGRVTAAPRGRAPGDQPSKSTSSISRSAAGRSLATSTRLTVSGVKVPQLRTSSEGVLPGATGYSLFFSA